MSDLVSQNKYSKHRGCSRSTVQRAIADGRITDALVNENGKTLINLKLADELWEQNTDPRRANNALDPSLVYTGKPESFENSGAAPTKKNDFQTNRTVREAYAARMAKLNYEKMAGKLVEVKKVKEYIRKIHSRMRDNFLNLPDKIAPKVVSTTDLNECVNILDQEIRSVCESINSGDIEF